MVRRHFISVSYSEDVPSNQIWYKTSNGEKFEYSLAIDTLLLLTETLQSILLKDNHLIHDDWWCLTFTNNITYTGLTKSGLWPIFWGLADNLGTIETNVLNIIEIKLPNVFVIGMLSFLGCTGLQFITIPNSVTSIGTEAFVGCSSLTSIVIPNSVKSIGDSTFWSCSSLTSITFNGTIDQWESVELGYNWNDGVPATVVHCTDGDITL